MDKSVEIKNHQLTLDTIRADIETASKELVDIRLERDSINSDLTEKKRSHEEKCASDRSFIMEGNLALDNRKAYMAGEEKRHKQELGVVLEQKKSASKELNDYNEWNFKGDEDLKKKRAEIAEHNANLAGRDLLEKDIQRLRQEYSLAETNLDQAKLETSLEEENARAAREGAERFAREAEQRAESAQQKQADAEAVREVALSEAVRIKEDCAIYIERVRELYREAFPDREMPI